LAEQTGLSRTEAKAMIDAYFETYPRLREYMDEQVKKARDLGYVETILGENATLPISTPIILLYVVMRNVML
jgi:DNA polymerase-1